MVDWPGLLKWTLQHTDTTKPTATQFKPMDEETKKWLEEAIKSYSVDEVDRMKEILEVIRKPEPEGGDPIDRSRRVDVLEELMDLLESGLESSRNFCIIGGLDVILKIIFQGSNYPKVREWAFRILASMAQNNTKVQLLAIEKGAFSIVNMILNDPQVEIREQAMSALSAIVRGENLDGIRRFIDIEGVELLEHILSEKNEELFTVRLKTKAIFLLKELLHHDEQLHLIYYEGDESKGTSKVGLNWKPKEEEKQLDQEEKKKKMEELKPYKGIVKKKLTGTKVWNLASDVLKNKTNMSMDLRTHYLDIIKELSKFPDLALEMKGIVPVLKEHQKHFEGTHDPKQSPNDYEITLLTELIPLLEGPAPK